MEYVRTMEDMCDKGKEQPISYVEKVIKQDFGR